MNIFNDIIRGASSQFGREFGRAGANKVLKGANSYNIENSHYEGPRSVNDTKIVRAIKDINKTDFVSTNKANVVRLLDITNKALENIRFNGMESISQIDEISILLETYNNQFETGVYLVDDDYKDKSLELLEKKRSELLVEIESFNANAKQFISNRINTLESTKKKKSIATILAFPILGSLGLHRFYLGKIGQGIIYLLFSWTLIPGLISLVEFISFLTISDDKFDKIFNSEYHYFKRFK